MTRAPRKSRSTPEVLAPVPDAILNQFAPEGMLTAAEVEAATGITWGKRPKPPPPMPRPIIAMARAPRRC